MNRETYKHKLRELLRDDESLSIGYAGEEIYQIDEITVYGGFDLGMRGIDHNILLDQEVTWDDIMAWGTVIVPETRSYISDSEVPEFEAMAYERLPLNRNHIAGGLYHETNTH